MHNSICTDADYLLQLLSAVLHGNTPLEKPDTVSFEKVFQLATEHHVANMAYYAVEQLIAKPEPSLLLRWKAERDQGIIKDLHQSVAREELISAFQAQDIRYIEAQGTMIKPFYPQSDYRSMSDLDFIVHPKDFPVVKTILQQLHYQPHSITDIEIDAFRKPDLFVEVHHDFFDREEYRVRMPSAFACLKDGVLQKEYFFLYSFLHFCKHYFHSGCGLRNVMDIYLLRHKLFPTLNTTFIEQQLKQMQFYTFYQQMTTLADFWFGDITEISEDLSDIGAYILSCGVYGSQDIWYINTLQQEKLSGKRWVKLRAFARELFPPVEAIATAYKIQSHPVLFYVPVLIYRFFARCVLKIPTILHRISLIVKS